MWTIYFNAQGEPNVFIAHESLIAGGKVIPCPGAWRERTLEDARKRVPPNLFRMPPQDGDDPSIVETWF